MVIHGMGEQKVRKTLILAHVNLGPIPGDPTEGPQTADAEIARHAEGGTKGKETPQALMEMQAPQASGRAPGPSSSAKGVGPPGDVLGVGVAHIASSPSPVDADPLAVAAEMDRWYYHVSVYEVSLSPWRIGTPLESKARCALCDVLASDMDGKPFLPPACSSGRSLRPTRLVCVCIAACGRGKLRT
jgi:hypothetical protein